MKILENDFDSSSWRLLIDLLKKKSLIEILLRIFLSVLPVHAVKIKETDENMKN